MLFKNDRSRKENAIGYYYIGPKQNGNNEVKFPIIQDTGLLTFMKHGLPLFH